MTHGTSFGITLVRKNVKQWNKEKVAKGSTVTEYDFSTYSAVMNP